MVAGSNPVAPTISLSDDIALPVHAILGYTTADLMIRVLPRDRADRLAAWIARRAFALRVPARAALEANLARLRPALRPGARARIARRAFEHFALSLVDFLAAARRPEPDDRVVVRGLRHLERARAAGRGVIVLSAHIGDWERGAAWLAAFGLRLHVVARPHPDPWVDRLYRRKRGARGVGTLAGSRPFTQAIAALTRGEWVAVTGDRPSGRRRRESCAAIAALARRTGALVLPGAMVRLPAGRYAACFGRPFASTRAGAGGYTRAMMRYVKRYPSQWLAFEPVPGLGG